jgi:hypothetical protein
MIWVEEWFDDVISSAEQSKKEGGIWFSSVLKKRLQRELHSYEMSPPKADLRSGLRVNATHPRQSHNNVPPAERSAHQGIV